MAIIYSYPKKSNPQGSDVFIITDPSATSKNKNRTKSVDLDAISTYVITSRSAITGLGSAESIPVFTGPTSLGNSNIIDDGVEVIVGVDFRVDGSNTDIESAKLNMLQGGIDLLDATVQSRGITFTHPAGGASANVNFYFAGAGAGSRFVISRGATGGPEIELESSGNVNINRTGNGNFFVGGRVTLDDYGSGAITGTPTFNLQVDANGNVIETTDSGITGSGTLNTIPLFTPDGTTLGDSQITQDAGANEVMIGSRLRVMDEAEFENEAIFEGEIDVRDKILDGSGAAGAAGQLLSSTGTGVAWVDDTVKYTSYVVKIQQSGATDPVLTEFENSTPFTFTATRTGVGSFDIIPSSSFVDPDKVYVQYGGSSILPPSVIIVKSVNASEVRAINYSLSTNTIVDGFDAAYLELRIYP